jgi:RimJ/RimL family protein N-acetyltransferase
MQSLPTTQATRDGRTIVIRALQPADKPLLVEGLERMSEESRYRRFLSPKPSFTSAELAYLTEVDHHDHEALIAIEPDSGEPVGVARYVRLADEPEVAEAALAVVDEWQHRGVGTALLGHLIARARQEEVRRFRASVLGDNQPMFRLLDQPGLQPAGRESSGPGVQVAEFDLVPESGWRQLLDALRAAARGDLTFRMTRAS